MCGWRFKLCALVHEKIEGHGSQRLSDFAKYVVFSKNYHMELFDLSLLGWRFTSDVCWELWGMTSQLVVSSDVYDNYLINSTTTTLIIVILIT